MLECRVAESELIGTLRLAGPIVLAELGWMAMGNVDIMIVGRVSTDAIAAVSLGTTLFYGVSICAGGVLWGMDTLVAQAFGAGDLDDGRRSLIQGIWVSLLLIPYGDGDRLEPRSVSGEIGSGPGCAARRSAISSRPQLEHSGA